MYQVATIVKTSSGSWKALVRKVGWPTAAKTFRLRRDAEDWARRTEDEMVRGVFIDRAASGRLTFGTALDRYLSEVTPLKRPTSQRAEKLKAVPLRQFFGSYSLAAITPELVARYRDRRLTTVAARTDREGNSKVLSPNTVRLELALLGHLFTTAIREWQIGLPANPVANVRKPTPGQGRNRRLRSDEEKRLREVIESHSNPMIGWIFEIALETGMRSSEITGLKLWQVDVERRLARLDLTKNHSARTVPLTKRAAEVFGAAIANPTRPLNCDLVFFGEPGRDGARRPYTFTKAWNDIKNSLGLADFRFHDLRHEAVSRFVEAGLSDQEVATISGHKSMQMLKRYTHLRAEDLVRKLDQISEREY